MPFPFADRAAMFAQGLEIAEACRGEAAAMRKMGLEACKCGSELRILQRRVRCFDKIAGIVSHFPPIAGASISPARISAM